MSSPAVPFPFAFFGWLRRAARDGRDRRSCVASRNWLCFLLLLSTYRTCAVGIVYLIALSAKYVRKTIQVLHTLNVADGCAGVMSSPNAQQVGSSKQLGEPSFRFSQKNVVSLHCVNTVA